MNLMKLSSLWLVGLLEVTATDPNGPNVVLYVDDWGCYDGRRYQPADLDKYVLERDMPYKSLTLSHAFFAVRKDSCLMASVDPWADVQLSVGLPTGAASGSTKGYVAAYYAWKQRYQDAIRIIPSIGGWSLSFSFKHCIETKPDAFLSSVVENVKAFNWDGIDFDWEYPNCNGKCGCQAEDTCQATPNESGPGDWVHYFNFLNALRKALDSYGDSVGRKMYMSMAVGMNINLLKGGSDLYPDPSPIGWFCEGPMDSINMMAYDYFGTWSPQTGPVAPLFDTPDVSVDDNMNADQALKYVVSHCKNPERLNMGLATYGKVWKDVPKVGKVPGLWQNSTNSWGWIADTKADLGNAGWVHLKGRFLKPGSGCVETFDEVSQTDTFYCDTSPVSPSEKNIFGAFDNGKAWARKMSYAKANKIGGAIIWVASDLGGAAHIAEYGDNHVDEELWNGLFTGWFGKEVKINPPGSGSYNYPPVNIGQATAISVCPLRQMSKPSPTAADTSGCSAEPAPLPCDGCDAPTASPDLPTNDGGGGRGTTGGNGDSSDSDSDSDDGVAGSLAVTGVTLAALIGLCVTTLA